MGSILDLIDWRKWKRVGFFVGTYSGRHMDVDGAQNLSAAWACLNLKSKVVGTLPCDVMIQHDDGSSEVAWNHPLQTILHWKPNVEFTAPRFWKSTVAALDLWGDAFFEKIDGTQNQLVALNWLVPSLMVVDRHRDTRELVYRYSDPIERRQREIPESKIVHIRGVNFGGERGVSAIKAGAKSMGIARDADESAGRFFANGIRGSGFLRTKRALTDEQREDARENIMKPMQGVENAGAWGLLEHDFEWQPISMNPEDAQLLESRRFSIEEICRWFDVPPIMIGHIARGSTMWGSGVQELIIQWLTTTVIPLCVDIERELEAALLRPEERMEGYVIKFNNAAMLRGTLQQQADYLTTLTDHGLMRINEARPKLNLGKVPGGDKNRIQAQMVSIDPADEADARDRAEANAERMQPAQPSRPVPVPANDRKAAA